MKSAKFVYAVRNDRLGARIGNLVAAWEFARKTGRTLVLNWQDYAELQTGSFSFFDFFVNPETITSCNDLIVDTGDRKLFLKRIHEDALGHIENHLDRPISYFKELDEAILFRQTARYVFSGPSDSNDDLRASLYANLRLNEHVQSALIEALGNLKIDNSVSVHLRVGDIPQLLNNISEKCSSADRRSLVASFVSRFAPEQAYISAVERFPNSTIFVFSDSDAARLALKAKFGDRVVDVREYFEGGLLTDAQIALCEMHVIMLTSEVVCTRSAFSSLACALSSCKIHPVFPYIASEALWASINSQMIGRGDQREVIRLLLDRYRRFTPKIIDDLTKLAKKTYGGEF